jgi:hypothetical protein
MIPKSGTRFSVACRLRRFTLSYCGERNDEPRPGPGRFGSLPGFGAATEPVVSRLFWLSRASLGAVAGRAGAVTTTSRFAPVLPSTIVTVTALVVFVCGAGDTIAAAARSVVSVGAAACGTDTSSGAFFAMRRSAGATATGSPPEGSRPTTAHNTKRPRNRPSATAMICAAGMLTARRRFLGPCPSGAVIPFPHQSDLTI